MGQQPWGNGVSDQAVEERKGGWEGISGDSITQLLLFSCKATECLQMRTAATVTRCLKKVQAKSQLNTKWPLPGAALEKGSGGQ